MTIEAGWYYAEGDPPGTVRRWNGVEWIGFPILQPTAEGTTPGNSLGVKPFEPVVGQVSLKVIAVVVQLMLMVVAVVSIAFGISMIQVAPYASEIPAPGESFLDTVPDGLATRFAVTSILTQLVGFFTGLVFVLWFFLAYRNMSLWHKNRRGLAWTVLAWIVPFVSLVRPMTMMMELAENSPRPEKRKDLNPIPVMVWWILWIFSQFALFFVIGASDLDDVASNLLTGLGVIALLSSIAAGLAIYIVQGITDAQESRRRPSAAQIELMREQAQIAAVNQALPTGIHPS